VPSGMPRGYVVFPVLNAGPFQRSSWLTLLSISDVLRRKRQLFHGCYIDTLRHLYLLLLRPKRGGSKLLQHRQRDCPHPSRLCHRPSRGRSRHDSHRHRHTILYPVNSGVAG
jgi:hypothetical protein